MKKLFCSVFTFILVCGLVPSRAYAQGKGQIIRCVAFYNLENLFDTIHDENKNDYEYLPDGGMKWTSLKFEHKIRNMAYAISQLGTDEDPRGAACIGVSEVENIGCLEALCRELKEKYHRDYTPILLEGPDRRGVDVGFLYNPAMFKPVNVTGKELHAHYADGGVVRSRLQLWISGYMLDDKGKIVRDRIHISVNHWPSRYGGEESSRATRDTAAMLCRSACDSIYAREPGAKIIIMGDLNDDPFNHSCAVVMNAKKNRKDVPTQGFFNTLWQRLENGVGTLSYQGSWNLFDQIIISEPLLNAKLTDGGWTYWKPQVFNKPFLTVQEGKEKGTPLRTVKSNVWQDGYSDHYPTMIYLIRNNQ